MVARNGLEVRLYDLVRTNDGYYGIVTGERTVFLGNGGEAVLSDDEIAQLIVMPLNIFQSGGPAANFGEMYEGHVCSQLERASRIEQQQRELAVDLA